MYAPTLALVRRVAGCARLVRVLYACAAAVSRVRAVAGVHKLVQDGRGFAAATAVLLGAETLVRGYDGAVPAVVGAPVVVAVRRAAVPGGVVLFPVRRVPAERPRRAHHGGAGVAREGAQKEEVEGGGGAMHGFPEWERKIAFFVVAR